MALSPDRVPPETLLLDYDLYPRHQIDGTNVANITRAREAGIELPPVIVWRKNKKVIDGFHRVTDALRHELQSIAVEWRDYKNEAAAFEDAMVLNAHGRQLTPYDKARCIQLAEALRLEPERLAAALCMTQLRLEELRLRKTAIDPESKIVPIKATLHDFAGTKLDRKQVEGNKQAGGMYPLAYVNQVINLLDNHLVDQANEKLVARLQELHERLLVFFGGKKSKRAG